MVELNLKKIQSLIKNGVITVPEILLKFYYRIGINEKQLAIILQIIRFNEIDNNRFASVEDISKYVTLDKEAVKTHIAFLMERDMISIQTVNGVSEYKLDGLYFKLAEEWSRSWEDKPKQKLNLSTTVKRIYPIFEKEFGRPLSPMENSQLIEWCEGDGFSEELIIEALKRSALRGALNFRYIDTILRQWKKSGIKNARDATSDNFNNKENINTNKYKKNNKNIGAKGKYNDLYMNRGG